MVLNCARKQIEINQVHLSEVSNCINYRILFFINSSPRLKLYRHIVAVKAAIDKQESTRKIVVPEHIQRGRNFVVLKLAEDIKLRRK